MNLRQVAVVVEDLATVQRQFFELLGLSAGFHDPMVKQFGLENVVMRIGETWLEVVSPVEEGTTAGRLLQKRGGDGGYMALIQVDNLKAERERLEATDIRIPWEVDIGKARAIHLHPGDVPGAIASMDEMTPATAWYWGGDDWDNRPRARYASAISAIQIQCVDPEATAQRWSLALNRPLNSEGYGLAMALDDTEIRFSPDYDGRGDGLQQVDIQTDSLETVLQNAQRLELPFASDSVMIAGIEINFFV